MGMPIKMRCGQTDSPKYHKESASQNSRKIGVKGSVEKRYTECDAQNKKAIRRDRGTDFPNEIVDMPLHSGTEENEDRYPAKIVRIRGHVPPLLKRRHRK